MADQNTYIGRQVILEYVQRKVKKLRKKGIYITDGKIREITDKYSNAKMSFRDILSDVDAIIERLEEEYRELQKLMEAYMDKIKVNKDLEDLPLEYSGITLNHQDIDLMMIECATTPEELRNTIESVSNSKVIKSKLTDGQLLQVKRDTFNLYQGALADKIEYIKNPNIALNKRLEYLKDSGVLSDEEKDTFDLILRENTDKYDLPQQIIGKFGEEKANEIFRIIKECDPVEKSGIKSTSMEAIHKLRENLSNYNSITIDGDVKYGAVTMADGSFDFSRLGTSLNFVKELDKTARLNTIMFYMDCPEELYRLEKNEVNKALVKSRLTDYVTSTARFIKDNDYEDTVRSIDVFNELLNRFPMDGEDKYKFRGDIPQVENSEGEVDDNIKSGWFKHLDIDDACDVIAEAREILPDTDFTYNDDNLIDPDKLEATKETINHIQEYEEEHDVKLIDSIGTQMHIDNSVTIEEIENMFKELSESGLPIEITEFDLAMTDNVDDLTDEQIEELRQDKMNEICEWLSENADKYNINGCTIWSKTDEQNFRVTLENEELISEDKEPIDTLHGGYYNDDMESKAENDMSIEEINEAVKDEPYREFNYHTHTYRCGHAGDAKDEEYVEAARSAGIKTLGFSDHVPYHEIDKPDPEHCMSLNQVDEYVSSINKLQEDNPEMTILSGFEVEYHPFKDKFFAELREKVDYLILGQHFVINNENGKLVQKDNNPNYPTEYAKNVCAAIRTGLFDIVAHPDCYMEYLDTIQSEEDKKVFLENAAQANIDICEAAKEMGIPLELNVGETKDGKDNGIPDKSFWETASKTGNEVIVGADAHDPYQLITMASKTKEAEEKIGNIPLNKVSVDYNPVERRKNNHKLDEAVNKTVEEAVSYETNLATLFVDVVASKSGEVDADKLSDALSNEADKYEAKGNSEDYFKKKIELIRNTSNIVKSTPVENKNSKEGIISHVRDTMEGKQSTNSNELSDMFSTPEKSESIQETKESNKVLQKTSNNSNNANNSNSGDKGFASIIGLAMIIVGMAIILLSMILGLR